MNRPEVNGKPASASQARAIKATARLVDALGRIHRRPCRARSLHDANCAIARGCGLKAPTLVLFVAANYFTGTFRVEGLRIFLK